MLFSDTLKRPIDPALQDAEEPVDRVCRKKRSVGLSTRVFLPSVIHYIVSREVLLREQVRTVRFLLTNPTR